MRSLYAFVLGTVIAVLIVRHFPTPEERHNARIGRFRLQRGEIQFGTTKIEAVFRIDTTTGQTWYATGTNAGTGSEMWWAINGPNDPAMLPK